MPESEPTGAQQTIFPLISQPGIKRDGTAFEGQFHTDGEWCRWQRGLPRKMGGARQISDQINGPVRGCYVHPSNGYVIANSGWSDGLDTITVTPDGGTGAVIARATSSTISASDNNIWQMDVLYDAASTGAMLVAHAAPNLAAIDSTVTRNFYYGLVTGTGAMTAASGPQLISGGIAVTAPYLFLLNNDGQVTWSTPNSVTDFTVSTGGGGAIATGGVRIAATKIVRGLPVRGGPSNSPSILFWSLDAVVLGSYVGGTAIFRFNTITAQSSVLSSQGIIEYDGQFFWPGIDRFLVYNGVVREVPNQMNVNYFFDNLTASNRQKVFATKITRFGEIWWFFPYGDATECNTAVIYNVRENTWYDPGFSPLSKRTAAYFTQVFGWPLMYGSEETSAGLYKLWQHEFGSDLLVGATADAVKSYYTTSDFAWPSAGPGGTQWAGRDITMRTDRFEPDYISTGNLTLSVIGRKFPQSSDSTLQDQITFSGASTKVDFRSNDRILRFTVESNVAGGNFQAGSPLIHLGEGDERP